MSQELINFAVFCGIQRHVAENKYKLFKKDLSGIIAPDIALKTIILQQTGIDVTQNRRLKLPVEIRRVYYYILTRHTNLKPEQIGVTVGRDRTTVLHHNKRTQELLNNPGELGFKELLAEIENKFLTINN